MLNKKIVEYLSLAFALIGVNSVNAQQVTPVSCENCVRFAVAPQKWNYVLSEAPDLDIVVDVYDIDGFDNSASIVSSIHGMGKKAVCYISAGTWENWRPDANAFPDTIIGEKKDKPGEKWLDIRQLGILGPLMQARVQMCISKGFDAVEFGNVDGYKYDTGFLITANDQYNYNTFLSNIAHKQGISAGLKNDIEQASQLFIFFDFAVNEECFKNNECENLRSFIKAGKSVFHVEYHLPPSRFCAEANALQLSSIKKNANLKNSPVSFCS